MEQENLEEFLTPITPVKQRSSNLATQQQQYLQEFGMDDFTLVHVVPDSPSKAQARTRLGSLLGQIRTGNDRHTIAGRDREQQLKAEEAYEEEFGTSVTVTGGAKRPGRPKKFRREKRVVFELRGKPFGLRDSGQAETIYSLCRKWMYGKDDELEEAQPEDLAADEFDVTRFKSLDLMATREIKALPLPRQEVPLMDPRPQKVLLAPDRIGAKWLHDPTALLLEHRKHWKNVKKNWLDYNQKRQQRYADSLQLLRTVYGIAQQTQM